MEMVELPPSFVQKLQPNGGDGVGPMTYVNYEASDQSGMEFAAAMLVNASEHQWLTSHFEATPPRAASLKVDDDAGRGVLGCQPRDAQLLPTVTPMTRLKTDDPSPCQPLELEPLLPIFHIIGNITGQSPNL
eukprot:SAG22_NODE_13788_length_395_cov_0.429054_1_plen_131_part_11